MADPVHGMVGRSRYAADNYRLTSFSLRDNVHDHELRKMYYLIIKKYWNK